MTIDLVSEFGAVLTGRGVGQEIRERIDNAVAQGEKVVVSFVGVEAMSPSFADEVFAKTDQHLFEQGAVEFTNINPRLEPIIRFVRAGRGPSSSAAES